MVKQKISAKKLDQPSKDTLPECPENQLDFQRMFPDEAACLRYLEKMCWPSGFSCAECSVVGEPFRISTHPRKLAHHGKQWVNFADLADILLDKNLLNWQKKLS